MVVIQKRGVWQSVTAIWSKNLKKQASRFNKKLVAGFFVRQKRYFWLKINKFLRLFDKLERLLQ